MATRRTTTGRGRTARSKPAAPARGRAQGGLSRAERDRLERDRAVSRGPEPDRPFPPEAVVDVGEGQPVASGRRFGEGGDSDWDGILPDPERQSDRPGGIDVSRLRPHVINLRFGRFSGGGAFRTTREDVESILHERLPAWLAGRPGQPARILLWAHGGLVSEESGLLGASALLDWWLGNGIYPIFFVWETGLLETIGQLIGAPRAAAPAARDLADWTVDPVTEFAVRVLGGPKIWEGMKVSAQRAFDSQGAAGVEALRILADAIGRLKSAGRAVELHAVGHSAGSIFHSYLLHAAAQMGLPPATSLSLLAPAITNDDFLARIAPRLSAHPTRLTMFTMARELELADNCGPTYRKSLLYLIHRGLEPETGTPILGLEDSVRADPRTAQLFGLGRFAGGTPRARVVWAQRAQPSAGDELISTATAHGAFDEDRPTLASVARVILQAPAQPAPSVAEAPIVPRSMIERWTAAGRIQARAESMGLRPARRPAEEVPAAEAPAVEAPAVEASGVDGRRTALCIGIDAYPDKPLSGCVADARLWASTLADLGFEVEPPLCDAQATRAEILARIEAAIRRARAGDVVVVQYSGHGDRVPDEDGDEADGDTPGFDEVLVPFDYGTGNLVRDDDLAALFDAIPQGVNVVCFFDSCNSGTVNRVASARTGGPRRDAGLRSRRLALPPEVVRLHAQMRREDPALRARAARWRSRAASPRAGSEISFSACQSHEQAFESGGQGHFTRHATNVLRRGIAGLTNEAFVRRVIDEFGAFPSQHPRLDCGPGRGALPLLRPLGSGPAASSGIDARRREVVDRIRDLLEELP